MNEIPVIEYHLSSGHKKENSCKSRNTTKVLVYNRADESLEHKTIDDLPIIFCPGDTLVFNRSGLSLTGTSARSNQLRKIRLISEKYSRRDTSIWDVLICGSANEQVSPGDQILLPNNMIAKVQYPVDAKHDKQTSNIKSEWRRFRIQFPVSPSMFYGYISAHSYSYGFRKASILDAIRKYGIRTEYVSVYSTSKNNLRYHHSDGIGVERVVISTDTASNIMYAKREGKRIIAVGSAVVRALESSADKSGAVHPMNGDASLVLTPGYEFRAVNSLLAPFYPSRSLSLLPVAAIMGSVESMVAAYQEAADNMYEFSLNRDMVCII